MNIVQANVIRANMGLAPIVAKPNDAKKRQSANQAKRAQESRDLKALRGSGKKAKG